MARTSSRATVVSDKVAEVVSGFNSSNNSVTLSTGVVLKAHKVSSMLMTTVMGQFKKPLVPRVYIQDMGREEENPNDPDYIEKLSQYQNDIILAVIDAMIISGTTLVSKPDGVEDENGIEWREMLEALGIRLDNNKKRTYLLWVKNVAMDDAEDGNLIIDAVGRLSGVSSNDVDKAVKQFRRNS